MWTKNDDPVGDLAKLISAANVWDGEKRHQIRSFGGKGKGERRCYT